MSFEDFVLQMKIPHVDESVCAVLNKSFKGDLNEFFSTARLGFNFALLDGIGEQEKTNINKWAGKRTTVKKWKEEYDKAFSVVSPASISAVPSGAGGGQINGRNIVLTGAVPGYSRGDVEYKVSQLGGRVHSAVNKSTDYIVVADMSRETVKLKAAKKLGIPIVSAGDFSIWIQNGK